MCECVCFGWEKLRGCVRERERERRSLKISRPVSCPLAMKRVLACTLAVVSRGDGLCLSARLPHIICASSRNAKLKAVSSSGSSDHGWVS